MKTRAVVRFSYLYTCIVTSLIKKNPSAIGLCNRNNTSTYFQVLWVVSRPLVDLRLCT